MQSMKHVLYRYAANARVVLLLAFAAFVFSAGSPLRAEPSKAEGLKRAGLDRRIEAAIDAFGASVPEIMDRGGVPGAATSLVDDQGVLWAQGFGKTGGRGRQPVTADTPFLICGLSKLITATTVMLAVQDGLVSLDEPITTYLPEFRIHSRYEENPERKITLRRLLDNTAGLPLEAPLGNYFEPSSTASFEDHVKSVFGSWLVYPVGSSTSYGSSSPDLAAYVIQVVSGVPYERYVKEKLFTPLGMSASTLDRDEILKNKNRAIGHMMGMSRLAPVYPGLASGGMYSTARDLARFVQLHINRGTLDGRRILDETLIDAIHKPVGIIRQNPDVYYGMAIHIDKRAPERTEQLRWHEGWGFGFTTMLHWYPEYRLGVVVLTNKLPHPVLGDLGLSLTDSLIRDKLVAKVAPQPEPDTSGCLPTWWGWPAHEPTPYQRSWRKYCGTHNLRFTEYDLEWWGRLAIFIKGRGEFTPRIKVHEEDGYLCITESEFFDKVGLGRHVEERLQEVKPGLFAAQSGMTLDFTQDIPTWRNYRLSKG
jgi:CubicO group peptidase (beta-lactamase class C family)